MAEIKYVSLSKLGYYDDKIKGYIDDADAALKTSLEGQIEVVAGELDKEIARAKGAEQTNATAAATAQAKGEEALTHSQTLAGKVGTVAEGKTVVGMIEEAQTAATYDDTEVRGLITGLTNNKADKTQVATDIAAAVKAEEDARKEAVQGVQDEVDALEQTVAGNKTAIEGTVATLEEKVDANESDIEGKMTALTNRVAANETAVGTTLPNAIDAVEEKVDTLIATDTGKSVRTIANEELAKQLIAEGADASLDTLQEIAVWIQEHPEDAAAMNEAIVALQNKVDTGDKTVSAYVDDAIEALKIGDYAKAADLTSLAGRVSTLETASATHALKTEVEAVADALEEYEDAHAGDYTNAQIDAAIKVVSDNVAALNDTYATDTELATAIENEVTRANGAYAAKSLETTVSQHVADTVAHTTSTEKALWNAALQASDIATGTDNGTIKVKGSDVAVKGLGSAAYTEASAYDVSGAAAGVQTKLNEEVARATAAEQALEARINEFTEITESEIDALFNA